MGPNDFRDIADDGTIVSGTGPEAGGDTFVQFNDETPIGVKTAVRNIVIRRDGKACAFKGQNGICYLVSRSGHVEPQGPCALDESVAFTPDGRLFYVVDPGDKKPVMEYVLNGVPHPMNRHTSQGVVSVANDGSIVWMDDQNATPAQLRTFGGVEFTKWRTIGPYTFGLSEIGCTRVNVLTQRVDVAPQALGTQWSLRGAIVNGSLVVVSSQPAVVVREADWQPYVASVPSPQPAPAPVPVPPVEEPPVSMPDSLIDDLRAERAKHPAHLLSSTEAAAILNAVAWKHRGDGWGLSAKPGGNRVWSIAHQEWVAYDILHHKPTDTLWDVATGEWELMQVQWAHQPIHHNDPARPWLAPVQPAGAQPEPVPVPPVIVAPPQQQEPKPCKCDLVALQVNEALMRMDDLKREIVDLSVEMHEVLTRIEAGFVGTVQGKWPLGTVNVTLTPQETK